MFVIYVDWCGSEKGGKGGAGGREEGRTGGREERMVGLICEKRYIRYDIKKNISFIIMYIYTYNR